MYLGVGFAADRLRCKVLLVLVFVVVVVVSKRNYRTR